jgi:heme-degrading monooxygenase HmoA
MYIQIINFNLKDVSEEEYRNLCDQLAPNFADLPGLVSKAWLADSDSNTYGGVYVWRDREAMVDFTKTELFNAVATHPNLANITSKDFAILEGPTRVTRGLVEAKV